MAATDGCDRGAAPRTEYLQRVKRGGGEGGKGEWACPAMNTPSTAINTSIRGITGALGAKGWRHGDDLDANKEARC